MAMRLARLAHDWKLVVFNAASQHGAIVYKRSLKLAQPDERKNGDNDDNCADEPDDAVHEMSPFIGQWMILKKPANRPPENATCCAPAPKVCLGADLLDSGRSKLAHL